MLLKELKSDFKKIEEKFDEIDDRFDEIDERFDKIEPYTEVKNQCIGYFLIYLRNKFYENTTLTFILKNMIRNLTIYLQNSKNMIRNSIILTCNLNLLIIDLICF